MKNGDALIVSSKFIVILEGPIVASSAAEVLMGETDGGTLIALVKG